MNQPDDNDTSQPWERQPGEGSAAWAAFLVYRNAGPGRSLTKTCTALGRARNTIAEHSARWKWNARAIAFDQWMDREATAAAVDVRREARARQARAALALQNVAMQRFIAMDPETMSVAEAIRAFQIGAEEERRALGLLDDESES